MSSQSILKGIFVIALTATALYGQSTMATITGLVMDSSGAIIPNAVVVATNTATGVRAQTVSSSTGNYVIPSLQVGSYEVSVSVTGFKNWTHSGINLATNDNARIDVVLEVGAASE